MLITAPTEDPSAAASITVPPGSSAASPSTVIPALASRPISADGS